MPLSAEVVIGRFVGHNCLLRCFIP
uniref:Uncharacterized protein n=1 Tax=Anguilla anguilla TaxID=7936 RepID=A0A0E9VZZ7_ANGAN